MRTRPRPQGAFGFQAAPVKAGGGYHPRGRISLLAEQYGLPLETTRAMVKRIEARGGDLHLALAEAARIRQEKIDKDEALRRRLEYMRSGKPSASELAGPCKQYPALFFSDDPDEQYGAKLLCDHCPFAMPCLRYALENGETEGIWGGMTPRERRSFDRQHLGRRFLGAAFKRSEREAA